MKGAPDIDAAVLVVGRGRSGAAAARLIEARGGKPLVADDRLGEAPLEGGPEGFPVSAQAMTVRTAQARLGEVAFVVVSPGVPADHPLLRSAVAKQVSVISELEFASRYIDAPIYAVTGTNGKSTTVSLLADALVRHGFKVFAGGNLGRPLCDAACGRYDVCVVEVSSFQLEWIESFAPTAAALLNIAPDHLDRHGTMENYLAAKLRIFENMTGGTACLGQTMLGQAPALAAAGLDVCIAAVSAPADPLMMKPYGCMSADPQSRRVVGTGWEAVLTPNWPRAPHDFENVAAAAALACAAGVSPSEFQTAVAAFEPLPHRLEEVGVHAGVHFWNDSKATNPAAVVRSAGGFPAGKVVLLAGGRAKGKTLKELSVLAPHLKAVVAFGESREMVCAALKDCGRTEHAAGMRAACKIALSLADPGDQVLLAPGCASFDEFADYAERGRAFAAWVEELGGKDKQD